MAKKLRRSLVTPIAKFVKIESLSGVLLFTATIAALIWANSPYATSYQKIWTHHIGFEIGSFELSKPLSLWVNDGLMAIFFFLIGLEIKREILLGELNSLKKASLPIFAAVGGVFIPIGLFLFLNKDSMTADGWGIPMATDIAFSLAILQLLGDRVPLSLKIFLTAFAIVDDLMAVLAIAIFYSHHIDWVLIGYALLVLLVLVALSARRYFNMYIYTLCGTLVWLLFLKSGIHPTIAGVLVALIIPIRRKHPLKDSLEDLDDFTKKLHRTSNDGGEMLSKRQLYLMDGLQDWITNAQSPLQQLEHNLHGWVAYFIIPIFAFANSGIPLSGSNTGDMSLAINLALALLIGKSLGVISFSFLGVKLGLAALPKGIRFKHIVGVSLLAGVGFTMAIFIANLAFEEEPNFIELSKLGILSGSLIAGLLGYLFLRFTTSKEG
ncbi:Na+/H+ antiporter NhaA [Mangrovimonas sp. TPBH4]|uniref:Na+/H+ antiporter NhaA n=1 Tax=Mangrovimonas sp. TPBH4 TaxID=1645914 RepID=UPI0006B50BA1|nr:Na+/H+ antiporter NhaA [Mangrovimonas sp. TPBH4]